AGRRLAAAAGTSGAPRVRYGDRRGRQVRAIEEVVDRDPRFREPLLDALLDGAQRAALQAAFSDAELIRDDEQLEARVGQATQRARGAESQLDARGVHVVRHVRDERAVLVEEYGAHGHDVSRTGSTMTSAMAVPSGCDSTCAIVAATFFG